MPQCVEYYLVYINAPHNWITRLLTSIVNRMLLTGIANRMSALPSIKKNYHDTIKLGRPEAVLLFLSKNWTVMLVFKI
jgi:hypothetical protein